MKSKKSKIMKMDIEAQKKEVENELIKKGYSTDEAKKMIEKHFENNSNSYADVGKIAKCIESLWLIYGSIS